MNLSDFNTGDFVAVEAKPTDIFSHDFVGTVKEVNAEYVVVEDQAGDCWSCDPDQIQFA